MDKLEAQLFLTNLFKDIKEQDNRCTASPYYFTIRDWKRVYRGTDGGEHYSWHDSCDADIDASIDGELTADEDEYLKEHFCIEDNTDKEGDEYMEYQSLLDNRYDFESFMEGQGLSIISYDYEAVYHNCFLTEKAAKQFLKSNSHHYSYKADTYVKHFWRNSEMKNLLIAAATLAGVEYEEK